MDCFDEKNSSIFRLTVHRAVIEDAIFVSKSIQLNIIEYEKIIFMLIIADVVNLFVDCAKEDLQGKIIAFIPTASLTEQYDSM